jgi:hypothetical protein
MSTFLAQVSAKLGITIDSGSIPNSTQVGVWLQNGHNYLMQRLPIDYFNQSIYTDYKSDLKTSLSEERIMIIEPVKRPIRLLSVFKAKLLDADDEPQPPEKSIASLTKWDIVSFDKFMEMVSNRNPFKGVSSNYPIAALSDKEWSASSSSDKRWVYLYYYTAGNLSDIVLKYLTETSITTDDSVTGDLAIIDELIVDYALAQVQMNHEEYQDAQFTMQSFENKLAAIVGQGGVK